MPDSPCPFGVDTNNGEDHHPPWGGDSLDHRPGPPQFFLPEPDSPSYQPPYASNVRPGSAPKPGPCCPQVFNKNFPANRFFNQSLLFCDCENYSFAWAKSCPRPGFSAQAGDFAPRPGYSAAPVGYPSPYPAYGPSYAPPASPAPAYSFPAAYPPSVFFPPTGHCAWLAPVEARAEMFQPQHMLPQHLSLPL